MGSTQVGKGFDRLAGVYDTLAGLVFGRAIRRAQCAQLDQLPQEASILLMGGGTGWLLQPLFETAKPRKVIYIDASQGMIERAKKFAQQHIPAHFSNIQFIHGTQDDIPATASYEVVITPFFLDLFTADELPEVVKKVGRVISNQPINNPPITWYLIDFYIPSNTFRPVAQLLVWVMYRFFRVFTGLSGTQLLRFPDYLKAVDYRLHKEKAYFGGMIISQVWIQDDVATS